MQVIYGPGLASNIQLTAQKRLIRPVYAQTQGFPYAASLDPSFRNTDGSLRVPLNGDTQGSTPSGGAAAAPLTRTANAFTLNGSLTPGLVMVKTNTGEYVAVHNGDNASASCQPMGLLGQWVAGTFDNLGQNNQVGIWMGPDSVYELLAPAWNDTGVATAITNSAASGSIGQVLMYAQTDGRLGTTKPQTASVPVARILDRPSAARLLIQLLV